MALISTKVHGAGDYAGGLAMIAAPKLLAGEDRRVRALLRAAGAGTLLASALTDYELGIRRLIPMKAHLALDAATGAMLAGAGIALRGRSAGAAVLLRLGALGGGEIAGAALTAREPGDRPAQADESQLPTAASTGTSAGVAAHTSADEGPPLAAAPVEAPGPSVTPPPSPEADLEGADVVLPETQAAPVDDTLVAREERAAAAEAARIGGPARPATGDSAMDPVYEAGGGEQEGWEAAEQQLIENASHDEGRGDPQEDAFGPELESDAAGAVYGEADHIASTAVVEDPSSSEVLEHPSSSEPDDLAAGSDASTDRGTGMHPREERHTRID